MNSVPTSESSGSGVRVSPLIVGSLAVIVPFFFPWIYFLGTPVPGWQLYKVWDPGLAAWLSPLLSGAILAAVMIGGAKAVPLARYAAMVAGAVPVLLFIYAFFRFGSDLLKGISLAGYAEIVAGAFLSGTAPRLCAKASSCSTRNATGSRRDEAEIAQ